MTKQQILESTGLSEEKFYDRFPTEKSYIDYVKKLGGSTPNPYPQLPTADNFFQYGVPVGPTITRYGGSISEVYPQIQNIDQFFSRGYSNTNNAYANGGTTMEAFPQARVMPEKFGPTDYAMLQEGGQSQATPSFATTRLQNFIDKVRETAYKNLEKEVQIPENQQTKKKGGLVKYPVGGPTMQRAINNIFDFENRKGTAQGTPMSYPTDTQEQIDYYYNTSRDPSQIDYSQRYGFDIESELQDMPGLMQHAADISFNTSKDPREVLLIAAGVIGLNDRASLQSDPANPTYFYDGQPYDIEHLWNAAKNEVEKQYQDDPVRFTEAVGDYRNVLYSNTNKQNFDQSAFDKLTTPEEKAKYLSGLNVGDAYRNSWAPRSEEMNAFATGFIPDNEKYKGDFYKTAFPDVDPATGLSPLNSSQNQGQGQGQDPNQMTDEQRFGFWPWFAQPLYDERKIRVNDFLNTLSTIANPFGKIAWGEAEAYGDMKNADKVRYASQLLSPFGDLTNPENVKKLKEAGYNINVGTDFNDRRALLPWNRNRLKRIEWNLTQGNGNLDPNSINPDDLVNNSPTYTPPSSYPTLPPPQGLKGNDAELLKQTRPQMKPAQSFSFLNTGPQSSLNAPSSNVNAPSSTSIIPFSGKDMYSSAASSAADAYMQKMLQSKYAYNQVKALNSNTPSVNAQGKPVSSATTNKASWDINALKSGITQRGNEFFIMLPDGTEMKNADKTILENELARRAQNEGWGQSAVPSPGAQQQMNSMFQSNMTGPGPYALPSAPMQVPGSSNRIPGGVNFLPSRQGPFMNFSQKWGGQKKKFRGGGESESERLMKKVKDPTTSKNEEDESIFKGGYKLDIKKFNPYASAKINAAAGMIQQFADANRQAEYEQEMNDPLNSYLTMSSSQGDYTVNPGVGANFRPDQQVPVFDQGVTGFRGVNSATPYYAAYGGEMGNDYSDLYFLTPQTLKYLKGR